MKVRVTKPKEGRVDLTFDDLRGVTGSRTTFSAVRIEEIDVIVAAEMLSHKEAKDKIRDARRLGAA